LNLKPEKINAVISFLAEHCLFDKQLYTSENILTSKGIQKRFQLAIRERAKKTPRTVNKYWLLDASETAGYISSDYISRKKEDFSQNYAIKKRKEIKENKLKESKGKENENKETKSLVVVVNFYKQNINSDVKDVEISEIQSWLEQSFDERLIIECIKIAVLNNKRSTSYISGILRNMQKNGIMTDVRRLSKIRAEQKKKKEMKPITKPNNTEHIIDEEFEKCKKTCETLNMPRNNSDKITGYDCKECNNNVSSMKIYSLYAYFKTFFSY